MTKDERIQGLLEANNRNVEKRRALAKAVKGLLEYFDPKDDNFIIEPFLKILQENGPE